MPDLIGLGVDEARPVEPAISAEGSQRTLTVLVADDEPDLVALMKRQLRRAGYDVITAADGAEAHMMARTHQPDVAVFDVQMPMMSGIEALEMLQADPATASIPVILVSAGFQQQTVRRGLAAGAADYLNKPLTERELTAQVAHAIDRSSYGKQMPEPALVTAAAELEVPHSTGSQRGASGDVAEVTADPWPNHESDIRARIGEMFGAELDAEDRDLLTGLIARFPVRCDELLDALDRAVESGDAGLVTQIAHSLRGAASNVGATNVAMLLEEVEVDAYCGVLADASRHLLDVRSELGAFSTCLQRVSDDLQR